MISERHSVDLLLCDFLQTAVPALDLRIGPRVVFQHNVEYLLRKRQWEAESSPLKKWLFAAEWERTRRIEEQICQSFDHVIAVSDSDRHIFAKEFGIHKISTIPIGVDSDYFQPQDIPQRPGRLAFVGSMDWYPNEDGVIWFLHEIYPRIRMRVPEVSFRIIGRNPSAHLKAVVANQHGVELIGRVPDVRPFLAEAEVVVVPLRVGGGTRIKIPEAMAAGKAVVSTNIGAEGLPFRNGQEIALADDSEEFAKRVMELLLDPGRRMEIERVARERVAQEHGWDSVVDRFEEILLTLRQREQISILPLQQKSASTTYRA
jgi:polysaccharide biosynthesis protein PslH